VEDRASEFNDAYQAKFKSKPSYSAAQAYDAISIVKEAVEKAGKADKPAIADALREVDYEGACTDYKSDKGNGLSQSGVLETFDATGTPKVEKTVPLPAPANGG
jgi:ABC-type branched-subunit amino acid transport system substrate-binding protein